MKKLLTIIGIFALVIVFVAAILALLSLFNLIPFLSINPNQNLQNQDIVLIARVDTLDSRRFSVEEYWLVYFVKSRKDTAITERLSSGGKQIEDSLKLYSESQLIREIRRDQKVDITDVLLIDAIGWELVNSLLEKEQNRVNLDELADFCEILVAGNNQLVNFSALYTSGHIRTTISETQLQDFMIDSNNDESFICKAIEP